MASIFRQVVKANIKAGRKMRVWVTKKRDLNPPRPIGISADRARRELNQ